MRYHYFNASVFNHATTRQASERRLVGSRNGVGCCSLDLINGNHEREL
jgi:hypothetical protein